MQKFIIASGPVIVEDNKVLLNKHGDTTFWKFCGGRVESLGDSLIETAKQEVMDEMGIEVEILDSEPYIMHKNMKKDGQDTDIILVHFLAKRIGEVKAAEKIREWDWLDIDKLDAEDLAPNIIPTLKHFKFRR